MTKLGEDYLQITPSEVLEILKNMNANKAVPKNDVSTKVFKAFADQLSEPIAMLINDAIVSGYWPISSCRFTALSLSLLLEKLKI